MATMQDATTAVPLRRLLVLGTSVTVMLMSITWVFLAMRAVMDIGGACASGGPYVPVQPCPSGAGLMAIGVPLMMVTAFVGSAVALPLGAPNLLVPMWTVLFGSLGWNFLEYGAFSGEIVWGWLICGIVFELMALPGLLLALPWGRDWTPPRSGPSTGPARWWVAYAVLAVAGVALGWATFTAWTT